MSLSDKEIRARIEAALYASGRPLSPEELARAGSITSLRRAVRIAREIGKKVRQDFEAIEIAELGDQKFVMQLKTQYTKVAKRFATRPLVPYSVLKTLSYVAYFQPISSLELVNRRGPQAYGHLRMLEDLGLIESEPTGRTRTYHTTRVFSDYFGLSTDLQIMKRQLDRAGLRKPPT